MSIWRRSAGVAGAFASCAARFAYSVCAAISFSLAAAAIASVSTVMYVFWIHPARLATVARRSRSLFTSSRNAVTPEEESCAWPDIATAPPTRRKATASAGTYRLPVR
jgi:hypothetical protein